MKTTRTPGWQFLMDQIILWWTRTTTTQKFLKICLKNKRYNWRWKILHAEQRQKQNRLKKTCCYSTSIIPMNERNWIGIEPGNSLCIRGFEESNPSSSTFSERTTRRWWSSSILENKRTSSESIPKKFLLGLTIVEKHAWQQEERKRDTSTALTFLE